MAGTRYLVAAARCHFAVPQSILRSGVDTAGASRQEDPAVEEEGLDSIAVEEARCYTGQDRDLLLPSQCRERVVDPDGGDDER